ncbi:hypothetical protein HDU96_005946 [Phlyctochytrium bullatum]|nr:hypothetical protein HDU96_005946 [Phlyctochytrium bullatum]
MPKNARGALRNLYQFLHQNSENKRVKEANETVGFHLTSRFRCMASTAEDVRPPGTSTSAAATPSGAPEDLSAATTMNVTSPAEVATQEGDVGDEFRVSNIIARLEQRLGRTKPRPTSTGAQLQEKMRLRLTPPKLPPERASTSPALLSGGSGSTLSAPAHRYRPPVAEEPTMKDGGEAASSNFVKVNGKWVETAAAKAFFMSATSVIDEEVLNEVQQVLSGNLVSLGIAESSGKKEMPGKGSGGSVVEEKAKLVEKASEMTLTTTTNEKKSSHPAPSTGLKESAKHVASNPAPKPEPDPDATPTVARPYPSASSSPRLPSLRNSRAEREDGKSSPTGGAASSPTPKSAYFPVRRPMFEMLDSGGNEDDEEDENNARIAAAIAERALKLRESVARQSARPEARQLAPAIESLDKAKGSVGNTRPQPEAATKPATVETLKEAQPSTHEGSRDNHAKPLMRINTKEAITANSKTGAAPSAVPSSISTSIPSARSVKKTIPDGDLLLAELDEALKAQSFTPDRTESKAAKVTSQTATPSMPVLERSGSSFSQRSNPSLDALARSGSSSFKAERRTGETTSAYPPLSAHPSRSPTSVIERSRNLSSSVSPRTAIEIQALADSLDAAIRSQTSAENLPITQLQPIEFDTILMMPSKSTHVASSPLDEDSPLNESVLEARARPERDSTEYTSSPDALSMREARRASRKRSAVAWSAKSVAKSIRESFAGHPGIEKIKDDLAALEDKLDEEEEADELVDLVGELKEENEEPEEAAAPAPKARATSVANSRFTIMSMNPNLPVAPAPVLSSLDNLAKQVEGVIESSATVNGQPCRFRIGDGQLHCIHEKDKGCMDHFPVDIKKLLSCTYDDGKVILSAVSSRKPKVVSVTVEFQDSKRGKEWTEAVSRLVTKDRPLRHGKAAIILLDEREPSKPTKEAFQRDILPVLQASGKEFQIQNVPFTATDLEAAFARFETSSFNAIACISARPKSKAVDDMLKEFALKVTGSQEKFRIVDNISVPFDVALALVKEPLSNSIQLFAMNVQLAKFEKRSFFAKFKSKTISSF